MGVIGGGKSLIGVNISLGVAKFFFLSDKDTSTCLVVMNCPEVGYCALP